MRRLYIMEDFVIGEQFQNTLWDTENHTDIKTPEEYAQFFQDILYKNENYQEVVLTVSGKNLEKSIFHNRAASEIKSISH